MLASYKYNIVIKLGMLFYMHGLLSALLNVYYVRLYLNLGSFRNSHGSNILRFGVCLFVRWSKLPSGSLVYFGQTP